MIKTLSGTIYGRTIELNEDLGVADGQQVEVQVRIHPPTSSWGDGLRRCAGALADDWSEEDDRILEEIRQERKKPGRPEIPE